MTEPTEAQLELLRDKYVLWDRAARQGPMDLRDYNRRAADALKAVLSVAQAEPAVPLSTISEGWRPTHRHVKRGTDYQVIGEARLQQSGQFGPTEGDALTIYLGADGKLWARAKSEFDDGRFEPIAAPPAPSLSTEPRDPTKLWASELTDEELIAEWARVSAAWREFNAADDEDIAHGGSPGEWMVERLDELATAAKNRGIELTSLSTEGESCMACLKPMQEGDAYFIEVNTGSPIHAACCGPEREGYTGPDGEPLKEGEPIPEPDVWTALSTEFRAWLKEIDSVAAAEGCETPYTEQTGPDCWLDAFNDGVTPAEAWAEEKAAGADCAEGDLSTEGGES